MLEAQLLSKPKTQDPTIGAGQIVFDTPGTSNPWVVPDGVFFISSVLVCPGAHGSPPTSAVSGHGGDLRWMKAIAVTPGETLTVVIGRNSVYPSTIATPTILMRGSTVLLQAAGGDTGIVSTPIDATVGIGGGTGGSKRLAGTATAGGGGAAGYSGNGGTGTAGTGGGGGGGWEYTFNGNQFGQAGGGVGLLGEGSNGTVGVSNGTAGQAGGGGSGGTSGNGPNAGFYGGGGGSYSTGGGPGGKGGARLIWGSGRFYPSTKTADV